MFLCEDCIVVFQVHTEVNHRKNIYCPLCGEYFEVVRYNARQKGESSRKIRWTDGEIKILMDVKSGKMQAHQAAILTGRSINSVKKKLGRI